jgi:hypothetical protein
VRPWLTTHWVRQSIPIKLMLNRSSLSGNGLMSFGKRMARRKGERKSIGIARENSCKESQKRVLFQASPNNAHLTLVPPPVPRYLDFSLFGATGSLE